MYVLEVKDLSFIYKGEVKKALDGVSLNLPYGKIMILAGPSGCGKTTLLRAITGLIPKIYEGKYQGSVLINGKNVLSITQRDLALNIGYVFQNPENQLVSYIVEREIAFGLENLGFDRDYILNKTETILKDLGIYELKDRPLRTLSDGQKQLVAIAGILVMEPKLLILDEPTSTLDPATAKKVANMINKIIKNRNISAIIVEHRMDLFLDFADFIAIMNEGKIVEFGNAEDVLERYSGDDLRIPAFINVQKNLYGKVLYTKFENFLSALNTFNNGG